MDSILCLSGWGQKFDSLQKIFDTKNFSNLKVTHFDYLKHFTFENCLFEISKNFFHSKILVGWSLGGQIALLATCRKILNPKLLILISPPFQMVKDDHIKVAMSIETFQKFFDNFCRVPELGLKKFTALTLMNNKHSDQISETIKINDNNSEQLKIWLKELKDFSAFNLDFSNLPRTLYFHGSEDVIVNISQSKYYAERIKNIRLEVFDNCGHSPHLNNVEKFRKILQEEISAI